jgi:DNA-binding transcriptional regulator YiaG
MERGDIGSALTTSPTLSPVTLEQLAALSRVRSLAASGDARAVRERAGLSLSEMAGTIGVGISTLSRWERAERAPRGEAALAYARVLEGVLHHLPARAAL